MEHGLKYVAFYVQHKMYHEQSVITLVVLVMATRAILPSKPRQNLYPNLCYDESFGTHGYVLMSA